jgi:probable HAF family extracellular repeat protein
MKATQFPYLIAAVLAVLTLPISAQDGQNSRNKHHRYKLIDMGTLGGPNSGQVGGGQTINNQGAVIAMAGLNKPDPFGPAPNCLQDCSVWQAIEWQRGIVTPLGALPGDDNSIPTWISSHGLIAGMSENGLIDPLTGFPQLEAVIWKPDHSILGLGTLGGNSSQAFSINDRGQTVGVALNTIPDQFAPFMNGVPAATQARAFLWEDGAMHDLGTLGGDDAAAYIVNERGHVVGNSFTNKAVNSTTGLPTVHPFLWRNGEMLDVGSLGGTKSVQAAICCGGIGLNNRDQVTGTSTLPGDKVRHPFLWEHGVRRDLGTLGGLNAESFFITESGMVVGRSDVSLSSKDHHAFSWTDEGGMKDLGTLATGPCSTAYAANSRGQIVGDAGICGVGGAAFIAEQGQHMVNLTKLVLPGSDLTLQAVAYINEAGEIAGIASLPNGDSRAVVLIPCDGDHREVEGCKGHVDETVIDDPSVTEQSDPTPSIQTAPISSGANSSSNSGRAWFRRNIHN